MVSSALPTESRLSTASRMSVHSQLPKSRRHNIGFGGVDWPGSRLARLSASTAAAAMSWLRFPERRFQRRIDGDIFN